MLRLLGKDKTPLGLLVNCKDVCVESDLKTGLKNLSFSYPITDELANKVQGECYIQTEDYEFVVKEVNKESNDWFSVFAKPNIETLSGKPHLHFEGLESKAADIIRLALGADTGWTVQEIDKIDKRRTIRKETGSTLDIINDVAKVFMIEIEFDTLNKKIKIYNKRGADKGAFFINSLNLKKLSQQANTYDFITRLIPIGKDNLRITAVNNGKEYIDNFQYSNKVVAQYWVDKRYTDVNSLLEDARAKLDELSKPVISYSAEVLTFNTPIALGDTITLIDNIKGVRDVQRVVKFKEYPLTPEKNTIEIANRTLSFAEQQAALDEAAQIVGDITTDSGTIDGSKIEGLPEVDTTIPDGSITSDKLAVNSITAEKVAAGAITTDKLAANSITTDKLTAGAITTDKISAGAITAATIAAGAITANSAIIAEGAIGTAQIAKAAITSAQIADGAIDNAKIDIGAINTAQIKDAAIGTAQIKDAAITTAKIGSLAVGTANIKDAAITNAKIQDLNANKITAGDISADRIKTNVISAVNASIGSATIDSAKIGNLSANKITSGDIATDRLKANAINAVNATVGNATINAAKIGNLSADKITTGDLSADRIKVNVIKAINTTTDNAVIGSAKIGNLDASKITTGTLSADRIGAKSIDASKIKAETISSIEVNAGNIVANKIASGEIKVGNANIVDGSISGAKISNATITNAQISSAFVADAYIKNLDAGKITSGTLDANKVNVKNLKADSITTGSLTVQGENLLKNSRWLTTDGWNLAKEYKLNPNMKFENENVITFNRTGETSIKDTYLSNYFSKIPATPGETFVGTIYLHTPDASAIDGEVVIGIWSYDAKGAYKSHKLKTVSLANNVWQRAQIEFTIPNGATQIELVVNVRKNGTVNISKPMLSRGSIASIWKPHTDEMISDGAITTDKIGDSAVNSDKLNVEQLFVSENAFINQLKAVELDAANITTGKISSERLDIQGLVSFNAFDESIKDVFDVRGNKTYINGGMIAANSIKADKIDLLSGITVKGPDGTNTFAISTNGSVEVNGLLHSGNFDESKNTGYKISPDGTAILNQATIRGDVKLPNAGITNYGATIGNENLLLKSGSFSNDTGNWRENGSTISLDNTTKYNDSPTIKIVGNAGAVYNGFAQLERNTTYIYSATVKANKTIGGSNMAPLHMWVNTDGGAGGHLEIITLAKTTITTEWNQVYVVFKTPNEADRYFMKPFIYNIGDATVWLANAKVEKTNENKPTPWCPHKDEQFNYVRFWAGTSFENRDSAPFRVYQNGDVFAANGTFTGLLRGTLDSGDVQIYNNALTVHTPGTETEVVRVAAGQSILNTDVVFGNNNDKRIEYLNGNKELNVNIKNTLRNSRSSFEMNYIGGERDRGTYLVSASHKDGGRHHIKYWEGYGGLIFESEGTNQTDGKENPYDFKFERAGSNIGVNVKVQGNLEITNSVKSDKQNIEMRSVPGEGWGFYAT